METNFLLQSDSYKYTHHKQLPPGTEFIYSYFESRGGQFPETVFCGLQYYLDKYLQGAVVFKSAIDEAEQLINAHISPGTFNRAGWEHILRIHNGRLPLIIKAVPEGTVVPTGNVLMTVENTDPEVPWLTNFTETMLSKVWYPCTVATQSREIKKKISDYLIMTGDPSLIDFKLHDFGYRGVSSEESAMIGAGMHLINFMGTDTIAGIEFLKHYYSQKDMPGFSIPASEHSTMTSWGGPEGEPKSMFNMLEQYPEGLVACVSDSYDIENACEKIWGGLLRDKVLSRNGTLVVRPDSGDPVTVVNKVLEILSVKFGYEINNKGYKVLNPKVRLIQGDGVNIHSISAILGSMKDRGWSADNIAFGMGGALLQQLNRDTQKFAFKCSHISGKDFDRDVFKQPKSDPGKNSKAGKLALVKDANGAFITIPFSGKQYEGFPSDELVTVFENGIITKKYNFQEIKERAKV
jgi:nicotinamide phosphoribosyltransferase